MEKREITIRDRLGQYHTYSANHLSHKTAQRFLIFPGLCVTRIVSGNGVWQIGSEACPVRAGQLVFLNNLEPRRLLEGEVDFEAFSTDSAVFGHIGAADCLRVFYGRTPAFSHALTDETLYRLCDRMKEEFLRPAEEVSPDLLTAYTMELLIGAWRSYKARCPQALTDTFSCDGNTAAAIAFSAAYINENLSAELRIPELAAQACMSTGYYSRMFRKSVSVPPSEYIARCRLQRFLSDGSGGNVLERAYACGFSSASGFYKACRRYGIGKK